LNECLKTNPNTHLISGAEDIEPLWLKNVKTVGVCGATSTPKWLMEEVADKIKSVFSVYILCDSQK